MLNKNEESLGKWLLDKKQYFMGNKMCNIIV